MGNAEYMGIDRWCTAPHHCCARLAGWVAKCGRNSSTLRPANGIHASASRTLRMWSKLLRKQRVLKQKCMRRQLSKHELLCRSDFVPRRGQGLATKRLLTMLAANGDCSELSVVATDLKSA